MNLNIFLTVDYLCKKTSWLTWFEISYGLNRNLIDSKVVVDYALLRLNENSSSDEYEIAMLSSDELDQGPILMQKLVSNEDGQDSLMDTWLYLYLS